jgi:hypothetical protein
MTDWTAQARASAEQWMAAQQGWWRTVLDAAPGAAAGAGAPGAPDLQRQAVETWRAAAHRVTDAQAEFLLKGLAPGTGSEAERLVEGWAETQRRLWEGWLAAFGGAPGGTGSPDPAPAATRAAEEAGAATGADPSAAWQEAAQRMVQALQESAEGLVRSQEEWAQSLRRSGGGKEGRG